MGFKWLMIKGISRDAGGTKHDSWMQFASLMAASLTAYLLKESPMFGKRWPHYESDGIQ